MGTRPKLDAFQTMALLTTSATYALIAVGGLVRASGSGLGCPDWPKCFDRWIPPFSAADVPPAIDPALFNVAKAWTEYINRLLGVTIGFLIFGTLVFAILHHRRTKRILYSTIAAFVLTGIEGGIGGKVVRSQLSPAVLTVHLVLALLIVSLLLYATVSAFFPRGRPDEPLSPTRAALARTSIAVMILTLAQIGLGALLRGEVQDAANDPRHLERGLWLLEAGAIRGVHQSFALIVGGAVAYLAWLVHERAEPDPWIRRTALAAVALVFLQALSGWGMTAYALPEVLQVAHLWIGTLVLGALTLIALLAYRLDPRRANR
jgi:heme a synthase